MIAMSKAVEAVERFELWKDRKGISDDSLVLMENGPRTYLLSRNGKVEGMSMPKLTVLVKGTEIYTMHTFIHTLRIVDGRNDRKYLYISDSECGSVLPIDESK